MTSSSVTPVITFLDVDSFEVQIWQRDHPETRGQPCVVSNSAGRILAASYEAKALGISRSETPYIGQALKKCGHLINFRKPDKWGKQDQSKLREATAQIVSHIRDFLNQFCTGADIILEISSSDEFYLDISAEVSREMEMKGSKYQQNGFNFPDSVVWEREKQKIIGPFFYRLPTEPNKTHFGMNRTIKTYSHRNEERLMFGAAFLCQLCGYLEYKTGLQMSGGVAKNKLLAKIGCGLNKPRKITVFYEEACVRVFKTADLSLIPGLGVASVEKLKETFGILHIREILKVPFSKLEQMFGKHKAGQIISWANGQDVEQVEPKLSNQITCNKPAGDIKTLTRFKKVLKDLTSEIMILLKEERNWYGRKATQLKVEYKFKESSSQQNNNMESTNFDIEDPPKLRSLNQRVLNYFHTLPGFSNDSPVFSELAFVLKNFVEKTTSEVQFPCVAAENMLPTESSVTVKNTLRVQAEISSSAKLPQFYHLVVGSFRITSNLQYSTQNVHIPTLLPDSELQGFVGYKLMKDFSPTVSPLKLLTDYNTYDELKHEFFSKWLRENKPKYEDAKFISFFGTFHRAFKTPLNEKYERWETYAMNINGQIYLWEEKSTSTTNYGRLNGIYMGELFEQIVTGRSPAIPGAVDGMTKAFPIQKVKFGAHTLLQLSSVDAQEIESGDFVQVQLQRSETGCKNNDPSFLLEKNLKVWSQAVLSGSSKVVIGIRDLKNRLTKIETNSVEELSVCAKHPERCFVFLNRVLEWISMHLPVHNERLVKKFSWIPGQIKVTCSTVPQKLVEKLVIPRIYLKKK